MRLRVLSICLLLAATSAYAQSPATYAPPDFDLWTAMGQAFKKSLMPFDAHLDVQRIMAEIQQEAMRRKAAADAAARAAPGPSAPVAETPAK